MWPLLAPFIDELGAALIGRLFLWRRNTPRSRTFPGKARLPEFGGDLQAFYSAATDGVECVWHDSPRQLQDGVRVADGSFASPITTGLAENDRVHVRRWWGSETGVSVIGMGGLVQLGYYWFDRLGTALAARGIEFWMMDEPFNHRRTPKGFLPGELIAGGGPEQLIAAVRQAVIDARELIAMLRARGHRVGIVGQSYGGWVSLLLALLEPDLEFVVPLLPMCDLPAWYRAGLPLSRGARRRFPRYSKDELDELLLPVNPIAWKPQLECGRIDLHAATRDRLVVYKSIELLAQSWRTRYTAHDAGHYSVFFGERLRNQVVAFISEMAAREPQLEVVGQANQ